MAGGPNVGTGGRRGGSNAQTVGVLNLLTDLAFNLLIFFVVLSSTEPKKGRPQQVPSANKDKQTIQQKAQNPEVAMTRTSVTVNGTEVPLTKLAADLKGKLVGKARPEDRIVVLRSSRDTPYHYWIQVTGQIEQAGGVITLQLDDEKEVTVK